MLTCPVCGTVPEPEYPSFVGYVPNPRIPRHLLCRCRRLHHNPNLGEWTHGGTCAIRVILDVASGTVWDDLRRREITGDAGAVRDVLDAVLCDAVMGT